jgi:hypothetical protein
LDHIFWIALVVGTLSAGPMFWLLTTVGKSKGNLPPDSALTHHGRRYSVWWEETPLFVGNTVCFGIMDGAFVSGLASVGMPKGIGHIIWMAGCMSFALLVTVLWFRNAVKMYRTHESWGWQWCGPKETDLSSAGPYHTVYFIVHAFVIVTGLAYLLWQPVSWTIRGLFLHGLGGYLVTVVHIVLMQPRLVALYNRPRD